MPIDIFDLPRITSAGPWHLFSRGLAGSQTWGRSPAGHDDYVVAVVRGRPGGRWEFIVDLKPEAWDGEPDLTGWADSMEEAAAKADALLAEAGVALS